MVLAMDCCFEKMFSLVWLFRSRFQSLRCENVKHECKNFKTKKKYFDHRLDSESEVRGCNSFLARLYANIRWYLAIQRVPLCPTRVLAMKFGKISCRHTSTCHLLGYYHGAHDVKSPPVLGSDSVLVYQYFFHVAWRLQFLVPVNSMTSKHRHRTGSPSQRAVKRK